MRDYQYKFIRFSLDYGVLCFGEFTLKSGRQSPYFFNSALFNDGYSLAKLGEFYASAIVASGLEYDMIFGPAYKGIPLGSAVSIALATNHRNNIPYCFNRKEQKDHGEGGVTLGAKLNGRVLIIDDVISSGTSVNFSVDLITQANATPVAVVIALDRQERGHHQLSATRQVKKDHDLKVVKIIGLDELIEFLQLEEGMSRHLESIHKYRENYAVQPQSQL